MEYSYDDQGRMKTLTTWQDFAGDRGRAVTTWNYEPATGRLHQKFYDDGKGPSYTYTAAGRLLTRTWARKVNGQDLVTTYGYTTAGELETVDYSNTPGPLKDVVYGYDRQGRQFSVTDSTGTRTTSFTDAGQPDVITWQDGLLAGTELDYHQDGLLRQIGYTLKRNDVVVPGADISYGYDDAGRFHTVTAGTDVFTYSYLQNSSLVDTVTARHGATEIMKAVKTWDNLNRLTQVENRNGVDLPAHVYSSHAYQYSSANQRVKVTREDGTYWDYGYDGLGQVTSGVKKKAGGTTLPGLSFGYLFDDIGNRRETVVEAAGGRVAARAVYSANLVNQYSQRTVPGFIDLLGEAAPDATVTVNNQPVTRDGALFFKSLAVNNSQSAVNQDVHVVGAKNDVGANGEDAVTEVQGKRFVPQTPEPFTYDDDGNLTADGRWSYEWDAENRLVAMETLAGLPASVSKQRLEFAYDSQSRRVSKKAFAWDAPTSSFILHSSSLFLYDGWNLIAELDALSVLPDLPVKNVFLWGLDLSGSLQGAGGVGGLLSSFSSSSSQYFCFDGNGNVVALVDAATGTTTACYEYDPFGNVVLQAGASAGGNTLRFSTKYLDCETGLVYYGYRYYAPGLGRWVSRDLLAEVGGTNLMGFVNNQPVEDFDLLGLMINCFCLDGWLRSKGISGFSSTPDLVTYSMRGPLSLTEDQSDHDILVAMLKSPRSFTVLGWDRDPGRTINLQRHIDARKSILTHYSSHNITYRPGRDQALAVVDTTKWVSATVLQAGVLPSIGLRDMWAGAVDRYKLGCSGILRAVMLRGIMEAMEAMAGGAGLFDSDYGTYGVGGVWASTFLRHTRDVGVDDWIPGDWGVIFMDESRTPGDLWNVIYLGRRKWWKPTNDPRESLYDYADRLRQNGWRYFPKLGLIPSGR